MSLYLINEFGKVAIASVCLLLVFLLRHKRKQSVLRKQVADEQAQLLANAETDQLFNYLGDPSLKIRPSSGTWYLHALQDAASPELQKTFEGITFREAVVVLNTIKKTRRQQILERMKLAPAFYTKLKKMI